MKTMPKPIISVANISKKYSLGERQPYYSFRDTLNNVFSKPIKRLVGKEGKLKKDEFWALNDVSFDIQEGEVVGIIGRNGAGKSTLLKILSQITPPTSGEIRLNGRVASLLEVGTGFHPELTGKENIYLNGAILGMKRWEINNKFDDIVEFAEISKFLDTPVKHYSSGMYMRLAFAVAAHLEPEILLIDEVLAVGDAAFQKKCLGKMDEISKQSGRTILFVSHNMGAIQNLCSRTICFDRGKVDFDGKTEKAIQHYSGLSRKFIQNTSLRNRVDRSGSQILKIVDFWLEDKNHNKIISAKSGDQLNLVFCYECKQTPIKMIDLGFSIHKSDLTTLSIVYSSYMKKYFNVNRKKGKIVFTIDKLPFNQGSYKIAARIVVQGEESDWIKNAIAEFDVESGDFYQVGAAVPENVSPLLIDGNWHD